MHIYTYIPGFTILCLYINIIHISQNVYTHTFQKATYLKIPVFIHLYVYIDIICIYIYTHNIHLQNIRNAAVPLFRPPKLRSGVWRGHRGKCGAKERRAVTWNSPTGVRWLRGTASGSWSHGKVVTHSRIHGWCDERSILPTWNGWDFGGKVGIYDTWILWVMESYPPRTRLFCEGMKVFWHTGVTWASNNPVVLMIIV